MTIINKAAWVNDDTLKFYLGGKHQSEGSSLIKEKRTGKLNIDKPVEVKGMDFGEALRALKNGSKLARRKWNGKNMFIVYMPPLYLPPFNTAKTARKVNDRTAKWIGEDKPLDCQPYIAMYNAQEEWIPGWVASQSDMLDEDWYIVE